MAMAARNFERARHRDADVFGAGLVEHGARAGEQRVGVSL